MSLAPDARLYPETHDAYRTAYQRDRDRIIHCRAFRRLKHKTQVFVSSQGDHYRTRLTHTIEVAQIARTLARVFDADEDLCEAIALCHDLGHPPFGHAGERTLHRLLLDADDNSQGFDHNVQTLRILTKLEQRTTRYSGLNPTRAVIEGTIKHSFPLESPARYSSALAQQYDIDCSTPPMIEAQIAGLADDIAYNHHDMDDGLRAGLFSLKDVGTHLPFMRKAIDTVRDQSDDLSLAAHMLIGKLLNDTVSDVIKASQPHLDNPAAMIVFSQTMAQKQLRQKKFLQKFMYCHKTVVDKNQQGQEIIDKLFHHLRAHPEDLPELWRRHHLEADNRRKQNRLIADYIAGMSDEFAQAAGANH